MKSKIGATGFFLILATHAAPAQAELAIGLDGDGVPFLDLFSRDGYIRPQEDVQATSFAGPIDGAALQGVIQKRLNIAQQKAMADAIRAASKTGNLPPGAVDLLNVLAAGVALPLSPEAAAQSLSLSLARSAFALSVHSLLSLPAVKALLDRDGAQTACEAASGTGVAVYHALSNLSVLRPLAWPEVAPEPDAKCTAFRDLLAAYLETAAAVGSAGGDAAAKLGRAQENASVVSDCVAQALSSDPAAPATPASVETLEQLRSLNQKVPALTSKLKDKKCLLAITQLRIDYESVIQPVIQASSGTELEGWVSLKELQTQVKLLTPLSRNGKPLVLPDELVATIDVVHYFRRNGHLNRESAMKLVGLLGWAYPKMKEGLQAQCEARKLATCPRLPDDVDRLLLAVIDALPFALVERGSGASAAVSFDGPALVRTAIAKYADIQRAGWYLRATIGATMAGYLEGPGTFAITGARHAPVFAEELGFGSRWEAGPLLHGWHVIGSGLLFQLTGDKQLKERVFLGAGYSVNIYRAIDLSASVGVLGTLNDTPSASFATMVGVQVPLFDYVSAVQESQ